MVSIFTITFSQLVLFSGVVTAMDESVGRMIKALGQSSMLENSIIVFISDNGAQTEGLLENYGSNYPLRGVMKGYIWYFVFCIKIFRHLSRCIYNYLFQYLFFQLKFTLFEGGIRGVACVYSRLIQNSSRISNELMHITDWLPTFYSAAGGNLENLEENMDGVDQWDTIVSGKESKRESVLLNIDEVEDVSSALIGKYKLIINGN